MNTQDQGVLFQCVVLTCFLVYPTVNSQAACGATLTSLTGVIQSPNFPNDYTNGLACVYVISVPDTYRVTLTFTNFAVENSTDCSYNYVEVRDGDSESSPRLGRYCGTSHPGSVRTSGNRMWIKFVTDSNVTRPGFRANYTSGTGQSAVNVPLIVGVAVGVSVAVIVVVVVVVIIVVFMKRRDPQHDKPGKRQNRTSKEPHSDPRAENNQPGETNRACSVSSISARYAELEKPVPVRPPGDPQHDKPGKRQNRTSKEPHSDPRTENYQPEETNRACSVSSISDQQHDKRRKRQNRISKEPHSDPRTENNQPAVTNSYTELEKPVPVRTPGDPQHDKPGKKQNRTSKEPHSDPLEKPVSLRTPGDPQHDKPGTRRNRTSKEPHSDPRTENNQPGETNRACSVSSISARYEELEKPVPVRPSGDPQHDKPGKRQNRTSKEPHIDPRTENNQPGETNRACSVSSISGDPQHDKPGKRQNRTSKEPHIDPRTENNQPGETNRACSMSSISGVPMEKKQEKKKQHPEERPALGAPCKQSAFTTQVFYKNVDPGHVYSNPADENGGQDSSSVHANLESGDPQHDKPGTRRNRTSKEPHSDPRTENNQPEETNRACSVSSISGDPLEKKQEKKKKHPEERPALCKEAAFTTQAFYKNVVLDHVYSNPADENGGQDSSSVHANLESDDGYLRPLTISPTPPRKPPTIPPK